MDQGTNDNQYFVSVSFQMLSRHRRKLGNAIYLFLGLCDLTTKECECAGLRFGAILGFAVLSDSELALRLGPGYTALTVRRMRRRLESLGLIIHHRLPNGYQLAVVGSNKGLFDERFKVPAWLEASASKVSPEVLRTQTKMVGRTDQNCTGDRPKLTSAYRQYSDDTENIYNARERDNLAFNSTWLKITAEQDEAFRRAFPHVDFPGEYDQMAAWLIAKGRRLRDYGSFARNWLKNIPRPVEDKPMPEPEPHPELLELLRRKNQASRQDNACCPPPDG